MSTCVSKMVPTPAPSAIRKCIVVAFFAVVTKSFVRCCGKNASTQEHACGKWILIFVCITPLHASMFACVCMHVFTHGCGHVLDISELRWRCFLLVTTLWEDSGPNSNKGFGFRVSGFRNASIQG